MKRSTGKQEKEYERTSDYDQLKNINNYTNAWNGEQ